MRFRVGELVTYDRGLVLGEAYSNEECIGVVESEPENGIIVVTTIFSPQARRFPELLVHHVVQAAFYDAKRRREERMRRHGNKQDQTQTIEG